jgi:uncharacterized RDD family membrane protein YckC
MQCLHCSAWNEEDERRCVRCGRRLRASAPRPAPEIYPLTSAAAPSFEALTGGRPALSEPSPSGLPAGGYQPSLFRDPTQGPKVVPIPMMTPRPRATDRKAPRASAAAAGASATGSRMSHAARQEADSQQSLDFVSGAHTRNPLGTEVEAVIYCDAAVALPLHRTMAFLADASMIAIAVGAFLTIFYLSGGQIAFTKQSALLFAGVIAVVSCLYRLLWCLGDGDTPGMQFAGLRLVNFDGRRPNREQRMARLAGSILSLASAGLGLVWALVDEENLTWHDHISKTFPSPS